MGMVRNLMSKTTRYVSIVYIVISLSFIEQKLDPSSSSHELLLSHVARARSSAFFAVVRAVEGPERKRARRSTNSIRSRTCSLLSSLAWSYRRLGEGLSRT